MLPSLRSMRTGKLITSQLKLYAKLLVKNGLKGVFINVSSGEGYMLTEEERMKLAENGWKQLRKALR